MTRPQSVWDQPDMACVPCRGRGWIITEDASGAPGAEVRCPYCKGRRNTWWVSRNHNNRSRHATVFALGLLVFVTGELWPSPWIPTAIGAVLVLAWFWWPRMPRLRRPHAPGFSGPREAKYVAGFGAAVGLRAIWDDRKK